MVNRGIWIMEPAALECRRLGRALLDQQLWCWGQDIVRPAGNGLLEYGMTRLSPPQKLLSVPSIYTWERGGVEVIVRGFGIGYREHSLGRIFIRRYAFAPAFLEDRLDWNRLWLAEDMGELRSPRRLEDLILVWRLCAACCDWISTYEGWVADHWGRAYRRESLIPWAAKASRSVVSHGVASAWRRVADACCERSDSYRRRAAG